MEQSCDYIEVMAQSGHSMSISPKWTRKLYVASSAFKQNDVLSAIDARGDRLGETALLKPH